MYNLNSQDVATVLNNDLVFALCSFIVFMSIIGIAYALSSLADIYIKQLITYIKREYNEHLLHVGDNMGLDIQIQQEEKHNNK